MGRVVRAICVSFLAVIAVSVAAHAGMPRGAVVSADEQDADTATGVTIARGNAEIAIEAQRIRGRADTIEITPSKNEIQFKGHALITIGDERYESEAVTCSLDFNRCASVDGQSPTTAASSSVDAAASSNADAGGLQPLPPAAGLGIGAAGSDATTKP